MGWRYRKSINLGGFRINFSKSGIGYSYGCKGYRKTKMANGRTRITYSIPNTGISYVTEQTNQKSLNQNKSNNKIINIVSFIFTTIVCIFIYVFLNILFDDNTNSKLLKQENSKISDNEISGVTYKTAGDEYMNYIKSVVHKVIDNNADYHIESIISTYSNFDIVIRFNNYIDEDSFKNIATEVTNNIYQELKKSNYKENGFGANYNIIGFTFRALKSNCKVMCDIQQYYYIDVLEVSKYKNLQEYIDNR